MFGADPRPHAKPASDTAARDRWPPPGSVPFGCVGSVVPPGFAAYRSVLHPAIRIEGDRRTAVTWAEVADWADTTIDAPVEWRTFADAVDAPFHEGPFEGSPPLEVAEPLVEVLLDSTATPDRWWIGVWDGFGSITGTIRRTRRRAPLARWRARRPDRWEREHDSYVRWAAHAPVVDGWWRGRSFLLFEGGPEAVLAFASRHEGPSLWWPDDAAWCVATDIDLPWTYVGADEATIGAIEQRTWLELRTVHPDDPITQG
ncbi:MAG: hypothetical protein AAFZ07_03795 [Actinomycetota bacterium]